MRAFPKLVSATLLLMFAQFSRGEDWDFSGIFEFQPPDYETFGISPRWGPVRYDAAPWIFSVHFGWMYISADSTPEGYWIWIENLGWLYSSSTGFPTVYKANSSQWVILDLTDKTRFKYFSLLSRDWWSVENPTFGFWMNYDPVPEEIRGVTAGELYGPPPVASGSSGINVGSYFLRKISNQRWGSVWEDYFYNEADGWFYPLVNAGSSSSQITFHYGIERAKAHIDGDRLVVEWVSLISDWSRTESYPIISP